MKSWFQEDEIEMYSTHSQGKCAVAEIFIKTLKNKVYKYVTSISENVCIDKLADLVNRCMVEHILQAMMVTTNF